MNVTAGVLIAVVAGSMNGLLCFPCAPINCGHGKTIGSLSASCLSLCFRASLPGTHDSDVSQHICTRMRWMFSRAALWHSGLHWLAAVWHLSRSNRCRSQLFSASGTMSAVGVMAPRLLLTTRFLALAAMVRFRGGLLSLVPLSSASSQAVERAPAPSKLQRPPPAVLRLRAGHCGRRTFRAPAIWDGNAMAHRLIGSAITNGGAQPAQASNAVLALVL